MNMNPASEPLDGQQNIVRMAAHALAMSGLVTAYGHCSMRLDSDHFLVCAPKPMSLIQDIDDGTIVPVSGTLPEGVLGEVRMHQHIYQSRRDVGGIVRSMPAHVITLSTAGITPRQRHGFGSYLPSPMPFWDDLQLIRNDQAAAAVAKTLGDANAIVLRGNGAVVATDSIENAVVLSWYLEDAARIEWQLLAAGLADASTMSGEQARARAVMTADIFERMWRHLTRTYPHAINTASTREHA
ncbi:class II aldolase/adducin family protein [Eoetvoesiella caeni]